MDDSDWSGQLPTLVYSAAEYYYRYRNEEIIKYLPYRPNLTVLNYIEGQATPRVQATLDSQMRGRTRTAWDCVPTRPRGLSADARAVIAQEHLPFADEVFDAVIWQRQPPLSMALPLCAEIVRVLAPHGRLIVWQPMAGGQAGIDWMATCLTAIGGEPFDFLASPVMRLVGAIPGLSHHFLARWCVKLAFAIDHALAGHPAWSRHGRYYILAADKGECDG